MSLPKPNHFFLNIIKKPFASYKVVFATISPSQRIRLRRHHESRIRSWEVGDETRATFFLSSYHTQNNIIVTSQGGTWYPMSWNLHEWLCTQTPSSTHRSVTSACWLMEEWIEIGSRSPIMPPSVGISYVSVTVLTTTPLTAENQLGQEHMGELAM